MTDLPDDLLDLQRLAFQYFLDHTNPGNGLVADNTREDSPCSIAATGLGLSCHPIAVANGWLKRADAAERVLTALRFFDHSPQGPEPDATGYKGFYYHFLEMKDGRRAGKCELSTFALPPECYGSWQKTFDWRKQYGIEYLHMGPLFIHELSHCWLDFRGISDGFTRSKGIDYFENSRRAVRVQQSYAQENPQKFRGYGP